MKAKAYSSTGRLVDIAKQMGIWNGLNTPPEKKKGKKKTYLYFPQALKYIKKLKNLTKPSKNVAAHTESLH